MRHHRLSTAALTAALTASLVLAGCGGDEAEAPGEDPPAAQKIAGGSALDSSWPLTGLDVSGSDSAAQDHPVLVTKIDNTGSSAPQVGLGSADLVFEELVEGGSTRLAAFYYSELPAKVGPVRSMRASDIGIVSPVDASVVTSGAAGVTIARIKGAGIPFFQEGAKGVYRDTARSAPYNVFANLPDVASAIKQGEERPSDYFEWGEGKDLPKGQKALAVSATFGGARTSEWAFRDGHYVNTNSYAAAGDEFLADTLLVLRVQVGDAGYRDPAGNPVPETKLEGKGQAMLFHDGRLVRGTWSKDGLDDSIELRTKAGQLKIPAGRTFVELVPAANGNVTFR